MDGIVRDLHANKIDQNIVIIIEEIENGKKYVANHSFTKENKSEVGRRRHWNTLNLNSIMTIEIEKLLFKKFVVCNNRHCSPPLSTN